MACLVEANRHRTDAHDQCPTCQTRFVGVLSIAAAEARVRDARASSSITDCVATSELASACLEEGRYAEALRHYQNVLRQQLERFGPDHLQLAKTQANMGQVYKGIGEYAQALDMYKTALPVLEAILGHNHPDVASTYNKCATVPCMSTSLPKCVHVRMSVLMCSIGLVYSEQSKLVEALDYYKRSLKIYLRVHGPDHPNVATTQNNIGEVYREQAKFPEALKMYQKSLATNEKVFGPEHLLVAKTYNK